MGVLNAAARAAAQPMGTRSLTFGAQPKAAAEHGGDARADLDGGAFASERDAAGERDGTAEEFAEDGLAARYSRRG